MVYVYTVDDISNEMLSNSVHGDSKWKENGVL